MAMCCRRERGSTQANAFSPALNFTCEDPPCPLGKLSVHMVCAPEDFTWFGMCF